MWLLVPESLIVSYIKEPLEGRDVKVKLIDLKKGFFYTIHIEHVIINKHSQQTIPSSLGENKQLIPPPIVEGDQREGVFLLSVQHLSIALDPFSLLKLSPRLNFSGQISHGEIHGNITRKQGGVFILMVGENIQVNGLPIIEGTGIYGDGTLVFNFHGKDRKGEITFSIDDARLKGSLTEINALPLNIFKSVKGLLTIEDMITVNSLTMQGKGIYVRIKGMIREHDFDGNIEIMMDSSFDLYPILQSLLERYKISTGYYVIPYNKKIINYF